MAEGGTKKNELRLHYKRANEQQPPPTAPIQTKEICQLAGQGNLQRRAPEQNLQPPEAFLWPHTKNMYILYTGNNITTLILVKINLVHI